MDSYIKVVLQPVILRSICHNVAVNAYLIEHNTNYEYLCIEVWRYMKRRRLYGVQLYVGILNHVLYTSLTIRYNMNKYTISGLTTSYR